MLAAAAEAAEMAEPAAQATTAIGELVAPIYNGEFSKLTRNQRCAMQKLESETLKPEDVVLASQVPIGT